MSGKAELSPDMQVSPMRLEGAKARHMALLLESRALPYVELIGCESTPGDRYEVVIFRIHVEVGQRPVHDIRRVEPLAVKFDKHDVIGPEILALREDFPRVPHLNLQKHEYPRSLCLYDEPYSEIKLRWTPTQFLTRLSTWLRDTSEGTLHRDDQALEPLLMPDELYTTIIHPNIFDKLDAVQFVPVTIRHRQEDRCWPVELMIREKTLHKATHLLVIVPTLPQTHGVITRMPKTLGDLAEFTEEAGLDLIGCLQRLLSRPDQVVPHITKAQPKRLGVVFLLILPKRRQDSIEPETAEYRVFFSVDANIFAIREAVRNNNANRIALKPANCTFIYQRDELKVLSGIEERVQMKCLCIGAGALGSQVLLNLARMGFGSWIIVDYDILLPHNIGRHALTPECIGKWKSVSLANLINDIMSDESAAQGIPANVLEPAASQERLSQALQDSTVIVDMSTSIAVSRWLGSDCPSTSRRISLFLNPTGTDLVMLAEDVKREVTLDCLEMQYYRHLVSRPELYANHLRVPDDGVRYGNTCRDVSSRIPQDIIALLSGIGSRDLRLAIAQPQAKITIWQSKDPCLRVEVDDVQVHRIVKIKSDDWTIITDQYVLDKSRDLRKSKLPNETGGILVGSFDSQRKLIYVVDVLPAPPDSNESPGSFERGTEGLPAKRTEITEISAGWLDYIGEWHSHPQGCSCRRSPDDCRQCDWISGRMQIEGLPGLMMIVNGDGYMLYLAYPE